MAGALLGGCAVSEDLDDLDDTMATQDLSAGACTSVKITAPTNNFMGNVGSATTLTAVATCPAGSTPEFQVWGKMAGAPNWAILGPYVPGSYNWVPPSQGTVNLMVVARKIGAPENYQVRSAAIVGTIGPPINHPPVASPDSISTFLNVAGSVDVLANDTDPEGDAISITGHSGALHGTVSFSGSVATYTPSAGFLGSDSFTYDIADIHSASATGTVTVNVVDQPPVAVDDSLTTQSNAFASVAVLTNDSDPDGDALSVVSFTQGAHGTVSFAGGTATYTSVGGYVGPDSFTYTIDDGHGMTATATVSVTVNSNVPGCTISLSAPATGTYGSPIHLVANAACNTGPADVQWYHKVNSSFVVVKPYSAALTFDYTADATGDNAFYALARTHGTTSPVATSSTIHVTVADNVPSCTSVKMVAPSNNASLPVNMAATLTASATCPAGVTPEYQFWVKPASSSTWQVLPTYSTGAGSWSPPSTGSWNISAVARGVGAHVTYQVRSATVVFTVTP